MDDSHNHIGRHARCRSADGVPRQSIHALLLTQEQTLTRMEESFSFAVQCMQADMAVARENLVKLRAQLGA